jgi:hypothetical protein
MSRKTKNRKPPKAPLKGGLGGSPGPLVPELVPAPFVDPRTPGKDLRLIQSAAAKGWQIRPEAMSALPDSMLRIALDRDTEVRARVSAAKVLCTMYGQVNAASGNGTTVNVGVVVNRGEDLLD